MTKEAREERIKELNKRLFELYMIDFWTNKTRETVIKLEAELRELEKED